MVQLMPRMRRGYQKTLVSKVFKQAFTYTIIRDVLLNFILRWGLMKTKLTLNLNT